MSERARRAATNGIWLCASCARLVDDDCSDFTVLRLRFWRQDAEDLAKHELGHPAPLLDPARFASIVLDPGCMWAPSHRLGKVGARLKAQPELGFHAIPEAAWPDFGMSPDTHSADPVFDLTLVNDALTTSVLSEVGFEVHSVWSDLKGLPQAYKVAVTGDYVLHVTPIAEGAMQRLQLPDPIAAPTGVPTRLKLMLAGFREHLLGNECLLRFIVIADGRVHRSRLVNVGVY